LPSSLGLGTAKSELLWPLNQSYHMLCLSNLSKVKVYAKGIAQTRGAESFLDRGGGGRKFKV